MTTKLRTPSHDLGETVEIVELNRHGRIKSIWITDRGIQYEVRYFDNAEPRSIYFYDDELQSLNRETDSRKEKAP